MSRIKTYPLLLPLAWLYGLVVYLRNRLFDKGLLPSRTYHIPILSVGNLTVGGTGKTPHIEYLVRLLQESFRVATLSRGYRRKSHGFVLADERTGAADIGDEPMQMHRKFPRIRVAVDANRCQGIERLKSLTDAQGKADVDVILLDDAYQHRYVRPGIQILLTDYNRPVYDDWLLPAGRLREPAGEKVRAGIVIVTKCPPDLQPIDFRNIRTRLHLYPFQELYFTTLKYGALKSLKGNRRKELPEIGQGTQILLVTGIANPEPLRRELQPYCRKIEGRTFADHHNFSTKDLERINQRFEALSLQAPTLLVTTEKDAARLQEKKECLSANVWENAYVCPIEVAFLQGKGEEFNHKIISYVRKNSRDSILAKS